MIKTLIRALWLPHRKATIIALVVGNFVFAGLILVEPIFFREIIDTLIGFEPNGQSESIRKLGNILLLWIGVGIVFLAIRTVLSFVADNMAHLGSIEARRDFFSHVLSLSMRYHGDTHSGKILKKFTKGSEMLFWTRLDFYRHLLPNFFTVIILVPLILFLNSKLAVTLIIFVLFFLAIAIPVMIHTSGKQKAIEEHYSKESALVGDVFANISVVKSFARIKVELGNLANIQRDIRAAQLPVLYWWAFLSVLSRISSTLVYLAVFFFGGKLYFQGEASIGDIVMFLGFATMLLGTLEGILWQIDSFFWRIYGIREYYEILDEKVEITDHPDATALPRGNGHVCFENIGFSYKSGKKALRDISLDAAPGAKIALVGHTGAGKSTIVSLLLRFYEPQTGQITIDGFDIARVTQDSLRQNIGVVFQENFLFHATVRENILVGKPDASEEEVIAAAKKSRAIKFIEKLPSGFDTVVGERGVKLSGGEKQRLAIARVILKNPPILVLDEATSALDAITEKKLQDALEEVMKGRTTLIIAHRLSTIRKADRILVLEDGRVVEAGSYHELLAKKGVFGNLVEAQTSGFVV